MRNVSVTMKKGQIFTWDMIFGITVFLVALVLVVYLWEASYRELRHAEEAYGMNWLAETVSEQLVRTGGEPHYWIPEQVVAYGLAEVRGGEVAVDPHDLQIKVSRKPVESRVLDADKILYLIKAFQEDYEGVRNRMLGSSRYDLYVELSCVNRSDLTCLQGLHLDNVNEPVHCTNTRVSVSGFRTDSYVWLEAEDVWGSPSSSFCLKGCSGGNTSRIDDVEPVTVGIDPGKYQIWVRAYEDNSDAKIVLDGVEHGIYGLRRPGSLGWSHVGEQDLDSEVVIGFADTEDGNRVDAVLLSTEGSYTPGVENIEFYGNPNTFESCIIGNPSEGSDTVSSAKTAVVGVPLSRTELLGGVHRILDKVVEVKVVVWGGEALPPREISGESATTTTTTLPPTDIICSGGELTEYCVANYPPAIDVTGVKFSGGNTLSCGDSKDFTVSWRGTHLRDPNYFAFYLDNRSFFLGACSSFVDEGDLGYHNYNMSCAVDVPEGLDVVDGQHEFIVTAEDEDGYCMPGDERADDQESYAVNIQNCLGYANLPCSQTYGKKSGCVENVNSVDTVYRMESNGLECTNYGNTADTYWGGGHGDSGTVYWTYLLEVDGSYVCLATCESTGATAHYNMSCTLNLGSDCDGNPLNIPDGQYRLLVTAETHPENYCRDPEAADAVGSGTVSWSCETGGSNVLLTYYIADASGVEEAELYSDVSGSWGYTAVEPAPTHNAGENAVLLVNVPPGTYQWNIKLQPLRGFLYGENQVFTVE